jgi:hypothetical protein
MPPDIRTQSVSPSKTFEISVSMREIFNSHWLEVPTIVDRSDGSTVWTVADDHWSLDRATWEGDVVTMTLRKYPGNHRPADLEATVDCVAHTARLGETPVPLAALEPALDAALAWQFAEPSRPAQRNDLLSRLQRFLRGER